MTPQNTNRMNRRWSWPWLGVAGLTLVIGAVGTPSRALVLPGRTGARPASRGEPALPEEPPLLSTSDLADGVRQRLQSLRAHRDARRARQHQAAQVHAPNAMAEQQPLPRAPAIPPPRPGQQPRHLPGAPR